MAENVKITTGDWVSAVYEAQWYIGKVIEVDNEECDALISFMEKTSTRPVSFKWPTTADEIWVCFDNVLGVIETPTPRGRSKRHYQLNQETADMIPDLFKSWLLANR